jgi:hypothetical protein
VTAITDFFDPKCAKWRLLQAYTSISIQSNIVLTLKAITERAMSIPDIKKSLIILLLLVAGSALAGEIYKWTDADGTVHYEDQPLGADAERLNIKSKATDRDSIEQQAASRTAANEERESAPAEASPSPAELRKKAKVNKARCEEYTARQESLETSRRFYREDEKGERTYLDDDQVQKVREQVQANIKEFCKP